MYTGGPTIDTTLRKTLWKGVGRKNGRKKKKRGQRKDSKEVNGEKETLLAVYLLEALM